MMTTSTEVALSLALMLAMPLYAANATPPIAADPNNPTGSAGLLVIDKRGSRIDFFDPVSYAPLVSLSVSKNPHELAVSPDHTRAYVTIYGPGIFGANPNPEHSIMVLDLSARTIIDTIDTLPYLAPHGIMVDRDGLLYVTCDAMRKLLIIDPVKHNITSVIDTEGTGHWLALLPDASKAYISSKTDKDYIAVIDLRSKRIVQRIPTPGGTEGITVSPDGTRVIAAKHTTPAFYVIDTALDKVIDEIPLQNYPTVSPTKDHLIRVRYTPDGTKLLADYYASGVLSVIDVSNLRNQTLLVVGKGPMGFAFSADGRTALVANHDYGTISIIALDGGGRYVGDFDAGEGVETLSFY
jgi:DNA-binding beta-propeller fold protein YncE